jgi:hypothetical protein
MAYISEDAQNALLDELIGSGAFSDGGDFYLALYTVAPTEEGGGTEVSGGSYARVTVDETTDFSAASSGTKVNGVDLTFPTCTASWGAIESWALHDHATDDSVVAWGLLSEAVDIDTGDVAVFTAGSLIIDMV